MAGDCFPEESLEKSPLGILAARFYGDQCQDEQALCLVFLSSRGTHLVSSPVILGKAGPRNSLAILFPFKTGFHRKCFVGSLVHRRGSSSYTKAQ